MLSRRTAALIAVPPLLVALCGLPPAAAEVESRRSLPVAPGVTLTTTETTGDGGPLRLNALSVDLAHGARVGYVDAGKVASAARLSEHAARTGAVAAVNGDFFDAGNSLAPLGAAVQDGEAVKSATGTHRSAATISAAGLGRVEELLFEGTAELPDGSLRIDRMNSHEIPRDGVGLFTARWGGHPRGSAVAGAERVTEVVLSRGVVREVRPRVRPRPVAAGETVLLGREAGADRLARLAEGDRVTVRRSLTADGREPHTAIGGRNVLLRGGRILDVDDSARQPRTAIGFSADGTDMTILVADGRHAGSRGATLREMAERLKAAGAVHALELDGGGSSALLARPPGGSGLELWNRTGEDERAVPNGLAVYAPEGGGRPHGLWVRPKPDTRPAPGPASVPHADPHRVFAGLTRSLLATAHDDAYGPVRTRFSPESVTWSATSGRVAEGRFTAPESRGRSTATVTATAGSATGEVELEVLPPPDRVEATVPSIAFPEAGGSATFGLIGTAPDGTRAPIEPLDATVRADSGLVAVAPRGDGTFEVRPVAKSGTGEIRIAVGDRHVSVPVGIGSTEQTVTTFDDPARWSAEATRATADVAPGRDSGLALRYDFTGSAGTRAAYAVPPAPLTVDGHTRALRLRLRGDANGARIAVRLVDGTGQRRTAYGPAVDWRGRRSAEIPVPEGTAQPVAVDRLYLVEDRASASYSGRVVFERLTAEMTPVK
ncbi:phosphodiester glycosidase family protein [Marinitenerispora sediminis]|uniref:Exopolysaccharide biosynthesis protein n=1 Tax=Marinitenerispora sediminis TaxID=1931232 RepID=A0A368T8H0_9ACTN|nr:phosphodiester glycosidase family protein [Marinitenerispora sediminis]RCV52636.1 exopolysaccharide biosynthesis protein [Marinitenerispora sediminis]RCV60326.1 exopolysaccharide biosynthesis protein [Marinitenerispora sediminis]RCV60579.1 exopolysaccharide biosynthesis protein [Marinitenerispora sediminis]